MGQSQARTVAFSLGGEVARADLPTIYERVCDLLRTSGATLAFCDVKDLRSDAVTLDALARVRLAASRHGCRLCLRHTSEDLTALIAFAGLQEVLE
jgi:ABC-type transporter Mla MlaB component